MDLVNDKLNILPSLTVELPNHGTLLDITIQYQLTEKEKRPFWNGVAMWYKLLCCVIR